ncbi:MAG TPA: hypothetical protein VFQ67_06465 [Allosphingosinicella sp.]|jgi:tRNA(Met) C34 N-acetyltransferase TmcA|nr:hypothetical protein [Allosphingosinicella sp.]
MTSTTDDRPASASATNSGAGNDGRDGNGRAAAARQAFESARERTAAAYASAREAAGSVYETAGRKTSQGIDSNPVAAVVGGLAIGAIVAALLPRTDREDEMLGSVGRKLNATARDAANAAKEAGRGQLDELGLSRDGLRSKLDEFTDRAVGAVKSSAGAAAGAARRTGEA